MKKVPNTLDKPPMALASAPDHDAGSSHEEISDAGQDSNMEEFILDEKERAEAYEKLVARAFHLLDRIEGRISSAAVAPADMDLAAWSSIFTTIKAEHSDFQYLIGVAGDTGMGKTTLLNALMSKTGDIAPSSQSGACTAAVCLFSHSKPDQTEPFFSIVHLKSQATVIQELQVVFQEKKELEDRVQIDGSDDEVVQAQRDRFQDQIKVIEGWSVLDEQRILELGDKGLAEQITIECKDGHELFNYEKPEEGLTRQISEPNAKRFCRAIKPYIGSVGKAQRPLWPLVEIANIYLESANLPHGVTLVDLPGEMDALESRGRIARTYYNKLDRLMVVTPCDRAVDNRTAVELIREDKVMDMEADGQMDGLCIVTTKIDQMDWKDFLENEVDPQDISGELPLLKDTFESKTDELDSVDDKIKSLKEELEEYEDDGEDSDEANGLKRKLNAARNRRQELGLQVEKLNARCFQICKDYRTNNTKRKLEEVVTQMRNSLRSKNNARRVSTTLPMFPVSSRAHRNLAQGHPEPRFPDAASTGFRALEEWMVQGSLAKREQRAIVTIHRCNILFDAADAWAEEGLHVALKLPQDQLIGFRAFLDAVKEAFREDFGKEVGNLSRFIRNSKKIIVEKRESSIEAVIKGYPAHVDSYQNDTLGQKLHWATFGACIRGSGSLSNSRSKHRHTLCWLGRVYTYYWSTHVLELSKRLNQRLPDYYTKSHRPRCKARVANFVKFLEKCPGLPRQFMEALGPRMYKIENLVEEYLANANEARRQFREAVRTIQTEFSRKQLTNATAPGYTEAQAITGRHKYKKQIAAMKSSAERMKREVFTNVAEAVDKELENAVQQCTKTLKSKFTELTNKIFKELDLVVREVCSAGKAKPKKFKPDAGFEELKESVARDVRAWRRDWEALKARLPDSNDEVTDEKDKEELKADASDYFKKIPRNAEGNVDFDELVRRAEAMKQNKDDKKKEKQVKDPEKAPKAGKKQAAASGMEKGANAAKKTIPTSNGAGKGAAAQAGKVKTEPTEES